MDEIPHGIDIHVATGRQFVTIVVEIIDRYELLLDKIVFARIVLVIQFIYLILLLVEESD